MLSRREVLVLLVVFITYAVLQSSALRQCTSQRILIKKHGQDVFNTPLVSSVEATSFYVYYDYYGEYDDDYRGENIFAYQFPLPSFYYSWCSGRTDALPNVTITLTERVLLYGLFSGGLRSQYVTNFSMEYSEFEDGPLLQHDPLGNLLTFTVPELPTPIIFHHPILVTTLHLYVLDYVTRQTYDYVGVCWTLGPIGCHLNETQTVPISLCPTDLQTSVSPLPTSYFAATSLPTSTIQPTASPLSSQQCSSQCDSQYVAVPVAISVVTVLLVAITVTAGLIVCWRIHQSSTKRDKGEERELEGVLRSFDNELYGAASAEKPEPVYSNIWQGQQHNGTSGSQSSPADPDPALAAGQNTETPLTDD